MCQLAEQRLCWYFGDAGVSGRSSPACLSSIHPSMQCQRSCPRRAHDIRRAGPQEDRSGRRYQGRRRAGAQQGHGRAVHRESTAARRRGCALGEVCTWAMLRAGHRDGGMDAPLSEHLQHMRCDGPGECPKVLGDAGQGAVVESAGIVVEQAPSHPPLCWHGTPALAGGRQTSCVQLEQHR